MPASKTFTSGSTLPASDINTYLNPSTAEHIAAATAAGTAPMPAVAAGAGIGSGVVVNFPAGRFTAPPVVVATSAQYRVTVTTQLVTATQAIFYLYNNTTGAAGASTLHWQAVQMS